MYCVLNCQDWCFVAGFWRINLSWPSIRRILNAHMFRLCKIYLLHQLNKDNFEEFCEILTERLVVDVNLVLEKCSGDYL